MLRINSQSKSSNRLKPILKIKLISKLLSSTHNVSHNQKILKPIGPTDEKRPTDFKFFHVSTQLLLSVDRFFIRWSNFFKPFWFRFFRVVVKILLRTFMRFNAPTADKRRESFDNALPDRTRARRWRGRLCPSRPGAFRRATFR